VLVSELEETIQELNDMPIDEFLHEVQLKGKSKANKANVPDDHVIISTIHQAKGLEWDAGLFLETLRSENEGGASCFIIPDTERANPIAPMAGQQHKI
jgi:superfamily I DNA/RNA helicase